MRIGIDIRNIGKKRTGDEMVFFNLVKNLAEIDNENNYKLFTDINNKETVADIKKRLGIENKDNFEIISLKSSSKFIWNFWTLPNYLRKNPVDIYHTQYITPFFVSKKINHHTKNPHKRLWNNLLVMLHLRKSGVGVKIITIVHDISFNFYPRFIKFLDLFFLKILIPMSLRRADKVIGVSKFTRDEIVKYYKIYPHTKTPGLSGFFKNYFAKIKEKYFGVGVNPGKVDFIYNAVGDDFLNNNFSSEQLSSVGKKYNLPENFIFHMGTMQPRKNIPILIKAYSKIKDRLGGTKLVLAGNKKAHNIDKEIDEVIKKLGVEDDVIFTGYIDQEDSPDVYKLANVFCMPSLYEGFGIPVLEAMSQGTPVIASDIPSLREVAGDAAIYFNPQDIDDLADKLYNACIDKELRNKLINLGSRQIEFFSWKKTSEKMLGIYKEL